MSSSRRSRIVRAPALLVGLAGWAGAPVIGLDRYRSFDVHQMDGPDRLVVDVGSPAPAPFAVPAG